MGEYRLHGPPGTGKTWTLATVWLPKAVMRFGPEAVVVCSLTRAAARVIAARTPELPREHVGTLHALCYRALGQPEIAEAHLASWNAAYPALALSGEEEGDDGLPLPAYRVERRKATQGDLLSAEAQALRHRMVPRDSWPQRVRYFQDRWDAWIEAEGYTDFTGLIEGCLGESHAPGRPKVLVVDEAQDCSALELRLIRQWGDRAAYTVLAGDGDQAIYGWRGASPQAFLHREIPPESNYHLSQSHRVPGAVHDVASRWVASCSSRYPTSYLPTAALGSVRHLSSVTSRYPRSLLGEVLTDRREGKTSMILASCGYSLARTLSVLRSEAVPFHCPYRPTDGAWNPLRGSGERLRALLAADGRTGKLWTLPELALWVEALDAQRAGLRSGAKARVKASEAARREAKGDADELAPAEIAHLLGSTVWAQLDDALRDQTVVEWWEARLLRRRAAALQYPLAVYRKHGRKALTSTPSVIVGTIHAVKGGEADRVYVYPDLSTSGMREWLQPGEPRDGVLRLFYVAMTRAKERLILLGHSSPKSVPWPRRHEWTPTSGSTQDSQEPSL